jgi:hypothetical protein
MVLGARMKSASLLDVSISRAPPMARAEVG